MPNRTSNRKVHAEMGFPNPSDQVAFSSQQLGRSRRRCKSAMPVGASPPPAPRAMACRIAQPVVIYSLARSERLGSRVVNMKRQL